MENRVGRHKQLLDDLKETRGHWELKVEALDRTLCGELALEEAAGLSEDSRGMTMKMVWWW